MHPVPMDGTDGKVANEPSRVRVSVVEPSGTWTFGLGKNRDVPWITYLGGGHTRVAHADRVARLFDLVMMNDRIFPYLLHLVINEKSPN